MTTSVFRSEGCIHGPPDRYAFGATSPPSPPPPPPPAVRPHRKNPPPPFSTRRMKPARRFPARPPPPRPRRMSPSPEAKRDGSDDTWPRRALVMEEVKILKRGEDLNPAVGPLPVDAAPVVAESVFCQTYPLGPDPDSLPRKFAFIDLDMDYSQPGAVVSPSPRSLPFPSFSIKKPSLFT